MNKLQLNKNVIRCFCVFVSILLLSGCSIPSVEDGELSPTPVITTEPEDILSGNSETDEPGPDVKEEIKKGYLFCYNDIEIAIDAEAAPILNLLGEFQSYFEADSCAVAGMIRTYSYGSFELDTYESEGKEYISCIYFKDDTIATAEGAYLFMTEEQLYDIYGADYTTEAGMVVYAKEGMKLKFIVTDNQITSIQYTSLVTEVKQ